MLILELFYLEWLNMVKQYQSFLLLIIYLFNYTFRHVNFRSGSEALVVLFRSITGEVIFLQMCNFFLVNNLFEHLKNHTFKILISLLILNKFK